jgi:hypothetical protein
MSTFLLVPVNEQGAFYDRVIPPVLQEATAQPAQFSHLFLFSHGWWTNANAAMVDYDRFIAGFTRCLLTDPFVHGLGAPATGSYLAAGMHWPSVLTEDAVSVLNYAQALSFFTMRARADTVGENAGYATLHVALENNTLTRFHLIGHSFGCRVVCNMVQKLLTNAPNCLDNVDVRVVLLEPAFDQEDLEFSQPGSPPQRYDLVLQNRNVRMLITRSDLDVALSVGYPLANVIGDVVNHSDGGKVAQVAQEILSHLVSGPAAAVATAAGDVADKLHDVWNRLRPQHQVAPGTLQAPVQTILNRGEPKALAAGRMALAALEAAHVDVAFAAGGGGSTGGLRAPFVAQLGPRYATFGVDPGWAGPAAGVTAGPQSVVVAELTALHGRPGGQNPPWNDHHSDIYLPEIYRLVAWFLFHQP